MKTKVLIAMTLMAALALLLVVFSEPGGPENSATESVDETFVDRAARTRLNTDISRDEVTESAETIVERAVRTRAPELAERADPEPQ
tara:strand:- start:5189 stop:5449 length:261 start_codon:yes stop_codon:yes gene_type:complete